MVYTLCPSSLRELVGESGNTMVFVLKTSHRYWGVVWLLSISAVNPKLCNKCWISLTKLQGTFLIRVTLHAPEKSSYAITPYTTSTPFIYSSVNVFVRDGPQFVNHCIIAGCTPPVYSGGLFLASQTSLAAENVRTLCGNAN